MRFLLTLFLATCLLCTTVNAGVTDRARFDAVDASVEKLGSMEGRMLKQIVDALVTGRADEEERARALYTWAAMNIDFDCKAYRHPKQQNNTASNTLIHRKATPLGYANFFKAMCDLAHIECKVITGLAKYNPENIGNISDKNEHAWNAVLVNKEWQFVDVTWAAGHTDKKVKHFTRSFSGGWFLADRELFALSHYPAKRVQQGLDSPFSRAAFVISPIIGPSAIINEVYPMVMRGKIRGRADTSGKIAFELNYPELVHSVSVSYKFREKAPVPYTIEENMLYVDIPFTVAGEYPVNIYINEVLAYIYNAKVAEPYRRRKPAATPPPRTTSGTRSSG